MPIYQKLEALKEAYFDENDFEHVLDKILGCSESIPFALGAL